MNVTIDLLDQSMRYGPVRLSVPPGFQNIIRLISHEVLRQQPKNMIEFIAEFLQDVLVIRENTGYDPALHGEVIELVQAQYAIVRRERGESSPPKRPKPAESAASGDARSPGHVEEKQATEAVLTVLEEVAEETVEPDALLPTAEKIEEMPVETSVEESGTTEDRPGTEEESTEDNALIIDEPAETTGAPAETAVEPSEASGEGTLTTEEPASVSDEPSATTSDPTETLNEPSTTTAEQTEVSEIPAEPKDEPQ